MRRITKNKFLKITVVMIVTFLIIFINSYVMAEDIGLGDLENYAQEQDVSTKFVNKVSVILSVFQMVGSIISVICLIVLGVKYMLGSVEEKATYKKTLMPYALGAIMVLGISNFINLVFKVATGIF